MDRFNEILTILFSNKKTLLIHAWLYFSIGVMVCSLTLSYSSITCHTQIPSSQIFWIYFIFNSSIFIGTMGSGFLSKSFSEYRLMFICTLCTMISLCLISFITMNYLLAILFVFLGLSIGMLYSAVNVSFVKKFPQQHFALIHFLHLFHGLGVFFSSILFKIDPRNGDCSDDLFNAQISMERMHLEPVIPIHIFLFVFATIQIPFIYVLFVHSSVQSTIEVSIEIVVEQRDQYQDIDPTVQDPNRWDSYCMKLVLLSAAITSVSQVLFTLFPFYLFTRDDPSMIHYQCFTFFFFLGRFLATLLSDKVAPYFQIGICIMGCGLACCIFIFDHFLLLGSAIFGCSLSQFLPSVIIYVKHTLMLRMDSIYVVVSGCSFGTLIYPLFLSIARENGSRVFVAINFFATLVLVFLYVCMLNVQAQTERTKATQNTVQVFIDRFFAGENSRHIRTRSLRPLISRLRPMSYRRFRNGIQQDVPKIKVTLENNPQVQYD